MIGAPHPTMSPTRAAGRPAISTVGQPGGRIGLGGCGPAGGGTGQVCRSPRTAAGMLPIRTVATPGPVITPPWALMSPTLAANGTTHLLLVDPDHAATDGRGRVAGHRRGRAL